MRFEMPRDPDESKNSGSGSSYSKQLESLASKPQAANGLAAEVALCRSTSLSELELLPLSGWISQELEALEEKFEDFVTPNSLRRSLSR